MEPSCAIKQPSYLICPGNVQLYIVDESRVESNKLGQMQLPTARRPVAAISKSSSLQIKYLVLLNFLPSLEANWKQGSHQKRNFSASY